MGQVVVDEASCRDAAVELGNVFAGGNYDDSSWPAGCFTVTSVFFNANLDPSSTSPDPASASAGICRTVPGIVVKHLFV